MRLAFVVTDEGIDVTRPSGPAAHIKGVVAGLEQNGITTQLFLQRDFKSGQARPKTWLPGQTKKNPRSVPPSWPRACVRDVRQFLKKRKLSGALANCIADFRPDVIYERSLLFSTGCGAFARDLGIQHLLETSGCAAEIMANSHNLLGVRLANLLESWKMQQANAVVVESQAAREWVRNKFAVRKPILAKPLAFALQPDLHTGGRRIQEVRAFAARFMRNVAFVGTFGAYQGTGFLMELAARSAGICPDIGFVLVGGGGNFDECTAFARVRRLPNVHFVGLVPAEEIPSYLSLCTIGIVPDSERYLPPIKTLQYGACGLPLLFPLYPGFEGVVVPGSHGLGFEPRSIESAIERIGEMRTQPLAEIATWGDAFRSHVKATFSPTAAVREVVEWCHKNVSES